MRKANVASCKRQSEVLGLLVQLGGTSVPSPIGRVGLLPCPGLRSPEHQLPNPLRAGRTWDSWPSSPLLGAARQPRHLRPSPRSPSAPETPFQAWLGLRLPLLMVLPLHDAMHPVNVVGDLGVDIRVPAVPTSLPREGDDAINLFVEDQGSPRVTLQSKGVGGRLADLLEGDGWGARGRSALTEQMPCSVVVWLAAHSMLVETLPLHSVRHRLRLVIVVLVSISSVGWSPELEMSPQPAT